MRMMESSRETDLELIMSRDICFLFSRRNFGLIIHDCSEIAGT